MSISDQAPPSVNYPLFGRNDPRRARNRLFISVTVGILTSLILKFATSLAWTVRTVAAWDAGALALLSLAWAIIWTSDVDCTRRHAGSEDPGRTTVWALVLVSSTLSLFAGTVVLRQAKSLAPESALLLAVLCLGAVLTAWALTHTAYTMRYAHLYYREDGDGEGGLVFPGDQKPDLMDFAYFAFTVGMCFQVSDVTITSRQIRRATLVHSVLSFAYNTAIVALALNLVFGMLG